MISHYADLNICTVCGLESRGIEKRTYLLIIDSLHSHNPLCVLLVKYATNNGYDLNFGLVGPVLI